MPDTYTHHLDAPPEVAELASLYRDAQANEKAWAERKDALAAQLKVRSEAEALRVRTALNLPDEVPVKVSWTGALTVNYTPTESWRVDATRLKREDPATYAAFAKRTVSVRLTVTEGES